MRDDDVYEIAKMWLPDENKGVIKLSSFTGRSGFVSLHFDDEYELYISRGSLLNLRSLINESIDALDAFEKFEKFESTLTTDIKLNNVLEFKRKDES
jgi:hypothetical protein